MALEWRLVLVFFGTASAVLAVLALIGGVGAYDLWMTAGAAVMTTLVYLEKNVDDRGRPKGE